jgi:3-methyladenine DNA glycosylase AlkD
MPTLASVMAELESKGSEKTRKIFARHGFPIGRMFGVSNADLKVIAKTIKKQQTLALELYATGNLDAMYLAGLVADGSLMSRSQLNEWASATKDMNMISEYTVPWQAVENAQGRELALEWIDSDQEHVAASGWCTYSGLVATKPDEALDLAEIESLLNRIVKEIHHAPNRVRQTMNGFVISVGGYIPALSEKAIAAARQIGVVTVDMGETACKVPSAIEYIEKMKTAGKFGQKRKTIRC